MPKKQNSFKESIRIPHMISFGYFITIQFFATQPFCYLLYQLFAFFATTQANNDETIAVLIGETSCTPIIEYTTYLLTNHSTQAVT